MFKLLFSSFLILFFSDSAFAHAGPHGDNECILTVGDFEFSLNGYQFQGYKPGRHYCRYFPHTGRTIIKIESISDDVGKIAVELQLLKRDSWLGFVLNEDDAFAVIKQQPKQYFFGPLKKGVVSIDSDIQSLDVYAIKLRLHKPDGMVEEQQFMFIVGLPFVQIMVGIAVLLLLFIAIVFLRQWRTKGQQQ